MTEGAKGGPLRPIEAPLQQRRWAAVKRGFSGVKPMLTFTNH
jgi:hypothetical protein